MNAIAPAFAPTQRSRLRRRPQRGRYDEAAVFEILDAGIMAHVGYVIDGQPFVTPTAYWREGRRLYWHGAAASLSEGTLFPASERWARSSGSIVHNRQECGGSGIVR